MAVDVLLYRMTGNSGGAALYSAIDGWLCAEVEYQSTRMDGVSPVAIIIRRRWRVRQQRL